MVDHGAQAVIDDAFAIHRTHRAIEDRRVQSHLVLGALYQRVFEWRSAAWEADESRWERVEKMAPRLMGELAAAKTLIGNARKVVASEA